MIAASVSADALGRLPVAEGLGVGRDPGFGAQQTAGLLLGLVLLVVGVWLWRQHSRETWNAGSYVLAAAAIVVILLGPAYLILDAAFQPREQVELCVDVKPAPVETNVGQHRVHYTARIRNVGRVQIHVDSVVMSALRDTADTWQSQSRVVAIPDIARWRIVDSVTYRAIGATATRWSVAPGGESKAKRAIILPAEEDPPSLHSFQVRVFLSHRGPDHPVLKAIAPDWIPITGFVCS
jgi:hypothetical protein